MSAAPSDVRRSRGAMLVLLGIGLAPALLNVVLLLVSWLARTPGGPDASRVEPWVVWMALVHAALILPIVLGTWWLRRGFTALTFAARVLAVAFVGLWVSLDVQRFVHGADPGMGIALTYARAISSPALYAALAALCTSIAFELGKPGLARFAQATNLICILHVMATLVSVSITVPPALVIAFGLSCWIAIVVTVWRIGGSVAA